jgi:DNA-binding IclR family transcriptional regulator
LPLSAVSAWTAEGRPACSVADAVEAALRNHVQIDAVAEREAVRERGYAEDNEEQEDGLLCIAVPAFDRFGHVVAGLSISFPTMRCGADTKAHYVALLKEAGRAISERMGYHEPTAG